MSLLKSDREAETQKKKKDYFHFWVIFNLY